MLSLRKETRREACAVKLSKGAADKTRRDGHHRRRREDNAHGASRGRAVARRRASSSAPRRISCPKRTCPASSRRRRRRSPPRWRKVPASAWERGRKTGNSARRSCRSGRLPGWRTIVIVEADGARRLPLKAHAAHEPVVPPEANQTHPRRRRVRLRKADGARASTAQPLAAARARRQPRRRS